MNRARGFDGTPGLRKQAMLGGCNRDWSRDVHDARIGRLPAPWVNVALPRPCFFVPWLAMTDPTSSDSSARSTVPRSHAVAAALAAGSTSVDSKSWQQRFRPLAIHVNLLVGAGLLALLWLGVVVVLGLLEEASQIE